MPATKHWSFANLDAAIEQVTPDVLALLADGVPRAEAVIVAALDGRHPKQDVTLTIMRPPSRPARPARPGSRAGAR
jgi:hypothetical protein